MSVWILTYYANEYNQHGEYFLAVFPSKPIFKQLADLGVPLTHVRHVLKGGGRKDTENKWYYLKEHNLEQPTC